ncbi:sensor domain-containing diguanylate cyclase [Paenibacillus pinistramenti]|uniref:sensor domain-containing diguanylate cyclase n=1 Tax=Paenibacillus pinistramenti TaxID=1768003 RepID=UPI001107BC9F|nr:sensor domain-containing diguanylate cyclase [Paenibacillus pinistramenti]
MAEYLKENRTRHNTDIAFLNTGNTQPAGQAEDWLDDMDITRHDFPYIEELLQQAFSNWAEDALPVYGLESAGWYLVDYTGKIIAGTGKPEEAETARLAAAAGMVLTTGEPERVIEPGCAAAAVPVRTRKFEEVYAVLVCIDASNSENLALAMQASRHFGTCFYRKLNQLFMGDLYNLQRQNERESARWTALLQIVKRIHDKIDVGAVLNEVLDSMSVIYPGAHLELLMTQDFKSSDSLQVKPLRFNTDNEHDELCVRAYTENTMLSRERVSDSGLRMLEIAVPLSGKQGVYGVFYLSIPGELGKDMDLQLMGILADTAGNAFENAKLYEQSNLLIQELQLINELSRQLSQSLKPDELFEFATKELLEIFKADFCAISELTPRGDEFRIMSTNIDVLDREPFPASYGICGLVYNTKEPLIISDYETFQGASSKIMESTDSRSLIGVPLMLRGRLSGAILLTHREPHFFSYDNYKLLQILASHIGLAMANASLYDAVQHMANRDMLTGLYARHYLDRCIKKRLANDSGGALLVVDIDKFKQVNDSYGHQVGDKILKQVCDIIKGSIRSDDVAARWGGEELAIYFPYMSADECFRVAERIRERVIAESEPEVTVSCGVGSWQFDRERISVELLFFIADMALYRAKNGGRNRTEIGYCDGSPESLASWLEEKDAL